MTFADDESGDGAIGTGTLSRRMPYPTCGLPAAITFNEATGLRCADLDIRALAATMNAERAGAQSVLDNSGTLEDLHEQVDRLSNRASKASA